MLAHPLSEQTGGCADPAPQRRNVTEGDSPNRSRALSDAEVAELRSRSPLTPGVSAPLPTYYSVRDIKLADLLRGEGVDVPAVSEAEAAQLVADLGTRDYWLTPLETVTNPYRGPGSTRPHDGRAYMSRNVGDVYDTSPYDPQKPPEEHPYEPRERPLGISTSAFVSNMAKLIAYVHGH
ncbi:hypothetical protein MOQ72_31650 [Saccharopolyspora sp. K220]|uniref:hypothetical protein n=1 Tax=Saccharopolyspora soli TaxID=2926618 RepID=UPI001F5ACD59|nr:hypothetical protein [Saccharopolyspora soli]MCI2421996.1 hypothetical protein [Saccharopolyspora soli]